MALKPVLRADAIVECQHGGKVIFDPCTDNFSVEYIPQLVLDDLIGAPISGCTLSHKQGGPCTKVTVVPSSCQTKRTYVDVPSEGRKFHLKSVAGALTDKGSALTLIDPAQYRHVVSETDSKTPEMIPIEEKAVRLYFAWQQPKMSNEGGVNLVAPRASGDAGQPLYPTLPNGDDFPVFPDSDTRVTNGLNSFLHLKINGGAPQSYQICGDDGMPLYQKVGQPLERPIQTPCIELDGELSTLEIAFNYDETVPSDFIPIEINSNMLDDNQKLPYLRYGMRLPMKEEIATNLNQGIVLERDNDYLAVVEASPFEQLLYRQQRQRQQFSAAVLHNHDFFEQLREGHAHAFTSFTLLDNLYHTKADQQAVKTLHSQLKDLSDQFWDQDIYAFTNWLDSKLEAYQKGLAGKSSTEFVRTIVKEKRTVSGQSGYGLVENWVEVSHYTILFDILLDPIKQKEWCQLIPLQAARDIKQYFISQKRVESAEAMSLVLSDYHSKTEFTFSLPADNHNDMNADEQYFATMTSHYLLFFALLYEFYSEGKNAKLEGFEQLKTLLSGMQIYQNHTTATSQVVESVIDAVNDNDTLKKLLDPDAMDVEDKTDNFHHQYRHLTLTEQQLAYDPPETAYTAKKAVSATEKGHPFAPLSHLLPQSPEVADALFGEFEFYCQQPTEHPVVPYAPYCSPLTNIPYIPPMFPRGVLHELEDITLTPIIPHPKLASLLTDYATVTPINISQAISSLLSESETEIVAQLTQQAKKQPRNGSVSAIKAQLFEHIAIAMPFLLPVTQLKEEAEHYWGADKAYVTSLITLLMAIKQLDDNLWSAIIAQANNGDIRESDTLFLPEDIAVYQGYFRHIMPFLLGTYLEGSHDLSGLLPELPTFNDTEADPKKARDQFYASVGNLSKVYLLERAMEVLGELDTLDKQARLIGTELSDKAKKLLKELSLDFTESADSFGIDRDTNAIRRSKLRAFFDNLYHDPARKTLIEKGAKYLGGGALAFYSLATWLNKTDQERRDASLAERYVLVHDTLTGAALMIQPVAGKVLNQLKPLNVMKSMSANAKSNISFKSTALLGGKVLNLMAVVASAVMISDASTTGDRSSKTVAVVYAAVSVAMILFPPTLLVNIAVNLAMLLWVNATKEDAIGEFVKRSLWYQNEFTAPSRFSSHFKKIAAVTYATTGVYGSQLVMGYLLSDNYVPYLQHYLGNEYDDQSPWLAHADTSAITELNTQALENWIPKGSHHYFEHHPLTDFLLVNYLYPKQVDPETVNPEKSDNAEERRQRLANALEYELTTWSNLSADHKMVVSILSDNSVAFSVSDGLRNAMRGVKVFLKDGTGQWGKKTLAIPKNEYLFILPYHSVVVESFLSEEGIAQKKAEIDARFQEAVFACELASKNDKGETTTQIRYFKAEAKVATIFIARDNFDQKAYAIEWQEGELYDAYIPTGMMKRIVES